MTLPITRALRLATLAVAIGAALLPDVPVAAQGTSPAVAPQETDGQINGQKARFVAHGDDVLVSVAEAERIGLGYRDGKLLSIGGTPLWVVTLTSVTTDGRTRLLAPAGVVPSIADYFAALRAHPAEALARSREVQVEINGRMVAAYDLGEAGVLLSPEAADGAGVKYRDGERRDLGAVPAWIVRVVLTLRAQESTATVIVAEPEPYFQALMAAADRARP